MKDIKKLGQVMCLVLHLVATGRRGRTIAPASVIRDEVEAFCKIVFPGPGPLREIMELGRESREAAMHEDDRRSLSRSFVIEVKAIDTGVWHWFSFQNK